MVPIYKRADVKDRIVEILKGHPEGLTVQQLADEIGVSRPTVRAYILELKGEGVIYRRRVGSTTLHYLKALMEKFSVNLKGPEYE